ITYDLCVMISVSPVLRSISFDMPFTNCVFGSNSTTLIFSPINTCKLLFSIIRWEKQQAEIRMKSVKNILLDIIV
ncbi:hypothetical protein, partial [Paraburkholderia sp. SIMBA_027]|uniref:hypothetical protein n=1 Tax=Paraburkholderia sp. SIMBA_027 TaxID=3085770 RepID=UPI00397D27C9